MTDRQQYLHNEDLFYKRAFERNIGILTEAEQDKLRQARVAVVGCGGVGGVHILNAVRLGVGHLNIADMDVFDVVNIQRQCGAYLDTIGRNKAEVLCASALAVNPYVKVKTFIDGVYDETVDEFLEGVDLFIDGIDFFCIDMRRQLFMRAYELGIPAVTAGPIGFGSALLVFMPDGMSFDEYFDIRDEMSYEERMIAFAVGLAPASVHLKYMNLKKVDVAKKTGPALVSSCGLASALVMTEVLRILLRRPGLRPVPHYLQLDPYLSAYKSGYLWMGNKNPVQRLKRTIVKRMLKKEHRHHGEGHE